MIKRILNFFFGKKETTQTPVNSIHDEINETLKKHKEILISLSKLRLLSLKSYLMSFPSMSICRDIISFASILK